MQKQEKESRPSIIKSLRLGFYVIIAIVIYAYGFQVTKVDLNEFRKESRQVSRIRVIRALAKPEILEYNHKEFQVFAPIQIPCPEEELTLPAMDHTGSYMVITPQCAEPGTEVQVEGFLFEPNTKGPLSFIPSSDKTSTLALKQTDVEVDGEGHFLVVIELPERPNDEVQYLRATTRRNVGLPFLSKTVKETWQKIVETVFLALLATTLGIFFSIPLSFIAAKNIMKDVKSPLTSIALTIIGWPIGIALGYWVALLIKDVSHIFLTHFLSTLLSGFICFIIAFLLIRWALLKGALEDAGMITRILQILAQLAAAIIATLGLMLLSDLGIQVGQKLIIILGPASFLGYFLTQLSDITTVVMPALVSLIGGAMLGGVFGKYGQRLSERLTPVKVRIINIVLAALAGALLFGIIAYIIYWLYQFRQMILFFSVMTGSGALLGIILALRSKPKEPLALGLTIYMVTRTILKYNQID